MNTPNKLTVLRMILVPVFLAVFLAQSIPYHYWWAVLVFSAAAITDAVDGKLARKNDQITVFGKLLDPVADKMLTTAALLGFMQVGLCNIWIVMIVLAREFAVTSVRLIASAEGVVIPANIWGKLKTVSQMTFTIVIMLLAAVQEMGSLPASFPLALISNILLWITAVLTVVSGVIYLMRSTKIITFTK